MPFRRALAGALLASAALGRTSGRNLIGQQAVVLLLDHRITLARALLQPWTVEHRDVAARVAVEPTHLIKPSTLAQQQLRKRLRGDGTTCPAVMVVARFGSFRNTFAWWQQIRAEHDRARCRVFDDSCRCGDGRGRNHAVSFEGLRRVQSARGLACIVCAEVKTISVMACTTIVCAPPNASGRAQNVSVVAR